MGFFPVFDLFHGPAGSILKRIGVWIPEEFQHLRFQTVNE